LKSSFCTALILCFANCATSSAFAQADTSYWQGQSIYQIFTDRFCDGNAANNNASGSFNAGSGNSVHGGDFQGIEQKLDYIKSLGFTAIWISPIVLNGGGQYHGYAGKNFYLVDPHWGTLANLQSMVTAAHARGLLVIQDVVVNHGATLVQTTTGSSTFNYPNGYSLRYNNSGNQYAAPFQTNATFPNLTNLFHNYGSIQDFGSQTQTELGELSGLDDFRTELPYVRTNMAAVYNYWIQAAGFDGFRVDTVKHTDMGFWQDWCPRVHEFAATNGKPNFFMFGEVFDGNDAKCGSYTGTNGGGPFKLDSVLDFPLYFQINSVFATASGGTSALENRFNNIAANYDPAAQMRLVTFLDNHDVSRFLNTAGSTTNRLALALTFQLTARGVPCVYYGTEQAFNGGNDPNNREDMFDGSFEQGPSLGDNFNMTHPLYQHIARLNNFRRLYPALRLGAHNNRWYTNGNAGLFAYTRTLGTQEVFVVFNTAATPLSLPARTTIHAPGTMLVNLLDPNEVISVAAGSQTPVISVPSTTAKLFVAQSQWRPLDPVIMAIAPAHDSTGVSALTPLVLHFSQSMDTNTVQAAFSTTPVVTGSFAWNSARDSMTFTPNGNWPGLSLITVRLASTAKAATTTNQFYAAFESRFTTATATDLIPPTLSLVSPTNSAVVGGLLTIAGTAGDNSALQKIEVRIDSNAWQSATGTLSWSLALNTSNFLNGTHTIAARATDAASNVSATNSLTVRFLNVPGAYLARIACGNPNHITNCDATIWLRDQVHTNGSFGYSGGTTGAVANVVTGICASAQTLYQRERYSTSGAGFRYWFECPIGVYETTLLEAETYWGSAGQRVFNVFLEGQQVLTNFDILVAAGGKNLPLTRTFTNSVSDSRLEALFTPVTDNARASGLQVRKIADLYSGGDGIPDWWRLAYFDHPTGQAADNSRAADDADNDGANNYAEYLAGTHPQNSNSVFKIIGLTADSQDTVRWLTVAGRTYQLQQAATLSGAPWTNSAAPLGGTGSAVTQHVVNPGLGDRFYRVQSQ
jgi:glycosidase